VFELLKRKLNNPFHEIDSVECSCCVIQS